MRRPRDNVVVHRSDPAPRIRSPASDRRIRSPDGTFDNERGPTIRNLAAFPAKAGRFPPGEAGLNERGELQSIVPIASPAPLRRESRRRALKRHGPDPGQLPVASAELPASGGMSAAGPFGESPPPGGGQGGRSPTSLGDLQSLDCLSNASLDFRRYLGPSGPWTVRSWPPLGGSGGASPSRRTCPARAGLTTVRGRTIGRWSTGDTGPKLVPRQWDGRGPHLQIPELSPRFRGNPGGSRRIPRHPGESGSDPDNSAVY